LFFIVIGCQSNRDAVEDSRLIIPDTGFSFKLHQRDKIEIPSTVGSVICQIDDITMGQTLLTISCGDMILLDKSIHANETLFFKFGPNQYQVNCEHIENLLIGNDYGYFKIQSLSNTLESASEIEKIEALLSRIEKAELVFIRNGEEYSSRDAAEHLRSKWKRAPEIVTLHEFIEKIASRSTSTGKSYEVKLKNGVIMSAKEWYETSDN
jgi:hypothetical protein